MREAMLSKADEVRLERLAEAQRRNQELIAALETAKERAEMKTRKSQHRPLQVSSNAVRRQGILCALFIVAHEQGFHEDCLRRPDPTKIN